MNFIEVRVMAIKNLVPASHIFNRKKRKQLKHLMIRKKIIYKDLEDTMYAQTMAPAPSN